MRVRTRQSFTFKYVTCFVAIIELNSVGVGGHHLGSRRKPRGAHIGCLFSLQEWYKVCFDDVILEYNIL